ncbi:Gfo/Idh/MocA family oxidoreductase, partial [Aduncisulcus paluster]
MINCAIAGLGRWGRALVEAAQGEPRLRITSAVEPDVGGAAGFCATHGLSLTPSLDDVLAEPGIDAQVFCEKPLALRRDDAAEMFAACRNAGVLLAVGHNRRFWPSMQALRAITASGELGTILHVEGHNSNENSQAIMQGWRLSPEESPGGGLTGAGLHVLDGFVSLLGPARQVYARLNEREAGPPPLDAATLAIEFVNGVSATLATVRATPFYWRVHVFGMKGSAEVL